MPPSSFSRFADRIRLALGFRRRGVMEDRLTAEVQFHIDMATEQNRRAGMATGEAHRAALVAFGGREAWRESARDEYRSRYVEEIGRDVRYALRGLRRSPGFTAAVVATLALSIGATVAMFSVVNAVLLRQLPYPDPDRIVVLCEHNTAKAGAAACNVLNPGNFMEWQDRARSFTAMGSYIDARMGISSPGLDPVSAQVRQATAGVFDVLHPPVLLGRVFTRAEDRPDGPHVIVLSSAFWRSQFGGDPAVIGRQVTINATDYTVIGVTSPSFQIFDPVDAWIPLQLLPEYRTERGRALHGIARLRPGVTIHRATMEMRQLAAQRAAEFPDIESHWTALVEPLRATLVGGAAPALWLLLGAVGFLLLIACANVANLMLARAAIRERELAVRISLGASASRVVRQLLTESLVLSFGSAAIGLVLAVNGTRALAALVPTGIAIEHVSAAPVDDRVLAFTTGVALLSGLFFGLAPAVQVARGRTHDVLKAAGRGGTSGSQSGMRMRGALVVAEISLAVVLLAGAALMARSLGELQRVELGFQPAHVLTAVIALPTRRYASDTADRTFFEALESRVRAIPGVTAVGAISFLPLSGERAASGFNVEGQPAAERGTEPIGDMRAVTPGYFSAMGIRILAGRAFTAEDRAGTPSVGIVSERLARAFWPGESALGHYLLYGWGTPQRVRIVGVAANVHAAAADAEPYMAIYRPHEQMPYSRMTLVIRGAGDPATYAAPLRQVVRGMDALLPVGSVRPMQDLVIQSLSKSRLSTALFVVFGGLGLLLAAIGIYGVMSYTVQQRAREMGIRMALGARPRSVLRLIVGRGLRLAMIGIAVGIIGAFAATRLMRSLLFEVGPTDRVTFVLVPVVLALIALVAAYIPGRRATRLDVVQVLRAD